MLFDVHMLSPMMDTLAILPIIAGAVLGGGFAAATSGAIIASAVGGAMFGANIYGQSKAASAAREQARLSNEATDRAFAYDLDLWDMTKERIIADRQHALDEIRITAENERTLATHKDAVNLADYNYRLQIRNREQQSLNNQYIRSNNIYGMQTTLNTASAQAGEEDELRSLQEIKAEASFQLQEDRIKQLQNEGKLRARGAAGRTAGKLVQANMADHGRQMAMLNESMAAAERNSLSVLREIQRDKTSADLTAYANLMLSPGQLPMPIVPFETPLAEYLDPRELTDADFGPLPVHGARVSPNAASSKIWANAIPGIAGQVANFATSTWGG